MIGSQDLAIECIMKSSTLQLVRLSERRDVKCVNARKWSLLNVGQNMHCITFNWGQILTISGKVLSTFGKHATNPTFSSLLNPSHE